MRKALIVGCEGQDGTYLCRLAAGKQYDVLGLGRDEASIDIRRSSSVRTVLNEFQPDEIYFLAAFHHSSEDPRMDDRELVERSFEVNTLALNHFLSGIGEESPRSRLFYAASSRIFGVPSKSPQDETEPINPTCAYGISKAAGMQLCRYYRARGVYASVGIFYNHESPLRPSRFISRKIVSAAVRISQGSKEKLVIGDMNARVDWGYAPDYALAAWQILQADEADDFVIGTGVTHSVREFVEKAFTRLNLDWVPHVVEDGALLTRSQRGPIMCADASKLYRRTGWRPQTSFEAMVEKMVAAELRNAEVKDADRVADPDLCPNL